MVGKLASGLLRQMCLQKISEKAVSIKVFTLGFLLMQYLAKIQEIIINHALDPFREMVGQDLRDILVNCGIVSEMLDMILSIGIRVE